MAPGAAVSDKIN